MTVKITPEMVTAARELFSQVSYLDPIDPAEEPIYDDDEIETGSLAALAESLRMIEPGTNEFDAAVQAAQQQLLTRISSSEDQAARDTLNEAVDALETLLGVNWTDTGDSGIAPGFAEGSMKMAQTKPPAPRRVSRVQIEDFAKALTSLTAAADVGCLPCQERAMAAAARAVETDPRWAGVIGVEGQMTGDGRLIEVGALRWGELPIPIRYVSQDVGAHDGAQVVGLIDRIERRDVADQPDMKVIWGEGIFDLGSEIAREAMRVVDKKTSNGVSMDLDDVTFEVRVASELDPEIVDLADGGQGLSLNDGIGISEESDSEGRRTVTKVAPTDEVSVTVDGRIRAATIVAIPAFADAKISLVAAGSFNWVDEPESYSKVERWNVQYRDALGQLSRGLGVNLTGDVGENTATQPPGDQLTFNEGWRQDFGVALGAVRSNHSTSSASTHWRLADARLSASAASLAALVSGIELTRNTPETSTTAQSYADVGESVTRSMTDFSEAVASFVENLPRNTSPNAAENGDTPSTTAMSAEGSEDTSVAGATPLLDSLMILLNGFERLRTTLSGISAKYNWVDDVGGLPAYVRRIARHLKRKGMTESHAIATAVNVVKKMCATGDVNFPGKQEVNPGSRAEACLAVADWERKKAQARADAATVRPMARRRVRAPRTEREVKLSAAREFLWRLTSMAARSEFAYNPLQWRNPANGQWIDMPGTLGSSLSDWLNGQDSPNPEYLPLVADIKARSDQLNSLDLSTPQGSARYYRQTDEMVEPVEDLNNIAEISGDTEMEARSRELLDSLENVLNLGEDQFVNEIEAMFEGAPVEAEPDAPEAAVAEPEPEVVPESAQSGMTDEELLDEVDRLIAGVQSGVIEDQDEVDRLEDLLAEADDRGLSGSDLTEERDAPELGEPLSDELLADLAGGSAEPFLVNGRFNAERTALHEQIVAKILEGVTPPTDRPPSFNMLGGGPASGKSFFVKQNPQLVENAALINPDDIKLELPEYLAMQNSGTGEQSAGFVHEESSYLAKLVQERAILAGVDITLDGTGDSSIRKLSTKLDAARAKGYSVQGYYVSADVDVALRRAEDRAARTGRHVLPTVIRETHRNVSLVLPEVVDYFDTLQVVDTSQDGVMALLASKESGKPLVIADEALWQRFLDKGKG